MIQSENTNNKNILHELKSTQWIGIYDDIQSNDDVIESNMIGKRVKTCPHLYDELKSYQYLCFLDTKLSKINETFVEIFIDSFFIKQNYALLLRKHWFIENNIWNEYNESMNHSRYKMHSDNYISYINKQLQNGLSETVENHSACGFLIRNMKHEKTNEINNAWYQHIQECGIQDQISFFFVKQLFNDCIHSFTEYPFL